MLRVFNKADLVQDREYVENLRKRNQGNHHFRPEW